MKTPTRVLHLEDNLKDAELLHATLEAAGLPCQIVRVDTEDAFRKALEGMPGLDLIISDFTLPSFDGGRALALAKQRRPDIPFIFVSGTIGEEAAIESLVGGATDYVLKHKTGRLVPAVQRALHEAGERKARREAEQALRQSEERYRRLFLESRDVLFIASAGGALVDINPAGLKMFGYPSKDDLLRVNIGRDLYWDSRRWLEVSNRLQDQGYVEDLEVEMKRQDGAKLVVLETTTRVFEREGSETFHGTWRDVTRQRELEAQFLRAQRMESVGSLAGGIAHDLNNVLSPIMLGVELLRETHKDPAAQQTLETLETCVKRGANLLKQILMFARGVEGRRVTVYLGRLIRNMEKMLKQTLPKSVQITLNIAGDLWTVPGDPTQFEQVLMNLSVNARDAMPDGGSLTVTAGNETRYDQETESSQAEMRRYAVIQVSDTGQGIAPENLNRIFDPFFTTKPAGEGTGLGLSTVNAILKSHGGFVRVHSTLGSGTTFKVYLPALPSDAENKTASNRVTSHVPSGKGELILIVDDEEGIRQIAQTVLEKHGYRTLVAPDGADALALYSRYPNDISLVLTDLDMPRMGGAELIRALERINPAVRVISTSGLASGDAYGQVVAGPVRAVLQKPFSPSELLETLRELLGTP